jgi:hypothetical protein
LVLALACESIRLAVVDCPDNRLCTLMNMDVFDRDFLLTLAPMTIERLHKHREGSCQSIRLFQALLLSFKSLIFDMGAAQTLHDHIVQTNHLCCQHTFDFVAWAYPHHYGHHRPTLPLERPSTAWPDPQRAEGLVGDDAIEVVAVRSRYDLEFAYLVA